MSFRTDLLPCLDAIQDIPGPGCLDLRLNAVFVVVRTYEKGQTHLGTFTDCETEITPRPMVRERNRGRELIVKPVHQKYTTGAGGGFDADTLNPDDVDRTEITYRIEGPNAGEYVAVDYSAARPFRQTLILKRIQGFQGTRLNHPQPQGTSNSGF